MSLRLRARLGPLLLRSFLASAAGPLALATPGDAIAIPLSPNERGLGQRLLIEVLLLAGGCDPCDFLGARQQHL